MGKTVSAIIRRADNQVARPNRDTISVDALMHHICALLEQETHAVMSITFRGGHIPHVKLERSAIDDEGIGLL